MSFPTGDETGTFLALDMGGTNLRVCEIILTEEKSEFDIIQSKYRMPEELKTGDADELWEYIADCLQQFIESHHADENLEKFNLGFTFSYPATQDYIDHGVLQRWTKGFDIAGVEGKNVVPMFEAALAKRVSYVTPFKTNHPYTCIGCSYQADCPDQRYHWYTDRFCLYGYLHENRLYLWNWMQRSLHGGHQIDSQVSTHEPSP